MRNIRGCSQIQYRPSWPRKHLMVHRIRVTKVIREGIIFSCCWHRRVIIFTLAMMIRNYYLQGKQLTSNFQV
ncbi:unnamed protein product [Lathyrus sativus]|nr:unnamed protein product [Lathyrus sativus]